MRISNLIISLILSVLLIAPVMAQTNLPPAPYQPAKVSQAQTKFFGVGGTVPAIDVTIRTIKSQAIFKGEI